MDSNQTYEVSKVPDDQSTTVNHIIFIEEIDNHKVNRKGMKNCAFACLSCGIWKQDRHDKDSYHSKGDSCSTIDTMHLSRPRRSLKCIVKGLFSRKRKSEKTIDEKANQSYLIWTTGVNLKPEIPSWCQGESLSASSSASGSRDRHFVTEALVHREDCCEIDSDDLQSLKSFDEDDWILQDINDNPPWMPENNSLSEEFFDSLNTKLESSYSLSLDLSNCMSEKNVPEEESEVNSNFVQSCTGADGHLACYSLNKRFRHHRQMKNAVAEEE